jgi:prepilin-type N-terminal cleavage/methylation domain-containing protein
MKTKAFTLIELLIVMAVIAILISITIPSFRGMQNEAKKVKAQGDLMTLQIAVESYYKNYNSVYPADGTPPTYQTTLIAASPQIIQGNMYDPFGATNTTQYMYDLSANSQYYILWSVNIVGNEPASVANTGAVTVSSDAIYRSNGH